jgi:protein-S-isoprenylcysteine O-methyltransferase Ste14
VGQIPFGPPTVTGKSLLIYLVEGDSGVLNAFDTSLAARRWSRRAPRGWSSSRPHVWRGAVLAGDEGGELDALAVEDGAVLWARHLDGVIRGIGNPEGCRVRGPAPAMTRLVLFAGFSAALVYLSRASLTTPRSHGFYRFLAWESIVALAVLNFRSFGQWFGDPLGLRQLVSWVLLFGSIVPAAWGAQALRTRGRPRSGREDGKLFEFEKTTQLVTTGPFTYVRHPLYSSLLLLAWGVFFKRPTVPPRPWKSVRVTPSFPQAAARARCARWSSQFAVR